jgi:hypothetical protein
MFAGVRMIASLDHSMWFHRPFRADEWLLYEMESPNMRGGRALIFGSVFTRSGALAISVAQEGVIRTAPVGDDQAAPLLPPPARLRRPKKAGRSRPYAGVAGPGQAAHSALREQEAVGGDADPAALSEAVVSAAAGAVEAAAGVGRKSKL